MKAGSWKLSWLEARSRRYHLAAFMAAVVLALALLLAPSARETNKTTRALEAAVIPAASAPSAVTEAAWSRLSVIEQRTLAPLKGTWSKMTEEQQGKWRLIADRFEARPRGARRRLAARIAEWARMSPQERAHARLSYLELTKRYKPMQRKEQWLAYQKANPNKVKAESGRIRPGLLPPASVQVSPGATTVLLSQLFDLPALDAPAEDFNNDNAELRNTGVPSAAEVSAAEPERGKP